MPENTNDSVMVAEKGPNDEKVKDFGDAINLPKTLTAQFVVNLAQRYNRDFESWFENERRRITDFDHLYRTRNAGEKRSKREVIVPIADNIVSTTQSRLVPALFSRNKLVDVVPESILPTDPEDPTSGNSLTNRVEDFINQTIVHTTQSRKKGDEFILNAILHGLAIGRSKWITKQVVRSEPVFLRDPISGTEVEIDTKKVTEERGQWDWEPVPLFDMAWEPRLATKIQDSTWVRQRSMKSLNELFFMQEQGLVKNIEKLTKKTPGAVQKRENDWEQRRREEVSDYGSSTRDSQVVWQLDEFWATINWRDKEGKVHQIESHFMVVENDTLIMFEENPLEPQRKPYFAFRYKLRPGEFMGTSILEPVRDLIQEINTNKGRFSDLIMKAANTPLLVDDTSGINTRNFFVRPGGIIPVENVAGVKPLPIDGGSIAATFNAISSDINLARESTAANEQAQGLTGGVDTATEARILQLASGSKFGHTAQRAGDEFIAPMAQEAFWMYRQFGEDEDMIVRRGSIDGEIKMVSRKDLQNDFVMIPVMPESQANKEIRIRQLKELAIELANIGVDPQVVLGIYRDHILPLMDINNGAKVLPIGTQVTPQGLAQGAGGPSGEVDIPQAPIGG